MGEPRERESGRYLSDARGGFNAALGQGAQGIAGLLENLPLLYEFPVHVVVEEELDEAVRGIEPRQEVFQHHHSPGGRDLHARNATQHSTTQQSTCLSTKKIPSKKKKVKKKKSRKMFDDKNDKTNH